MERVDAILIAGPTASGKSALALRLAEALGGAVVNADSMQVYGDLRILTARPSPAEEARAPHHLYGTVDAAVNYSVGRFLADAGDVLAGLARARTRPILVGGTGLYFKALTEGLSDLPPVPDAVRARVRASADGRSTQDLHAELGRIDPAGASIVRPSDRLRILRALETFAATGAPLSSFHGRRLPGPLDGRRLVCLFVAPDREALRARIDRRFASMMEAGALDEVAALGARGLDPALPIMRAHGVPALLAHLRGDLSREAAILQGQADTRRYVKRQFTWGRHQMPDFRLVAPEEAFDAAMAMMGQG